MTVNIGKKETEGERKTERLHPKQKRVKWVRVADERERESEREKEMRMVYMSEE